MLSCTPAAIVAPITAPVSYSTAFDATLWNAEQVHQKGMLRLTPRNSGIVVSFADSDAPAKEDTVSEGTCGPIPDDVHPAWVRQYNNAISLLQNAPQTLTVGATWKATVLLQTSPSHTTEVPVSVRVARKDSSGVLVQATGNASGVLAEYYQAGFTVTYQGAALFANGILQNARSAAQEPIQAGPYSQTMKYSWELTRQ
jgi:hypothetical protein